MDIKTLLKTGTAKWTASAIVFGALLPALKVSTPSILSIVDRHVADEIRKEDIRDSIDIITSIIGALGVSISGSKILQHRNGLVRKDDESTESN